MYLTELYRFYQRMLADPESGMPPAGMTSEKISFMVRIDREGNLLGEPVDLREGEKARPRRLAVPAVVGRSSNIRANYLWDKTDYALGMGVLSGKDGDGKSQKIVRTEKQFDAFRKSHRELLTGVDEPSAKALLRFLDKWDPSRISGFSVRDALVGTNVVFKLDGEEGFIHDNPALRALRDASDGDNGDEQGICLITGERGTVARTHPFIKGIDGAKPSGAALVSFNCDAFASYGKEQNLNAPVGEAAARGYTTALNYLLQKENLQCVLVGDTSIVFWADRPTPAEKSFADIFDFGAGAEAAQDGDQVFVLRKAFEAIRRGENAAALLPDLEGTRFYALGLAPNAARISVRFWLESSLGGMLRNSAQWYEDISIERQFPSDREYPPLWMLLQNSLAAQGDRRNIPPMLAGQLAKCVLSGGRMPENILAAVLQRIRSDASTNGFKRIGYHRVALIKAYLCRNKQEKKDMKTLNTDETNIGYRLGRLFALLEKAQTDALGSSINAPLREKYIGSASSTPRIVFPMLLRLAQHHVTKAKKSSFEGYETVFSKNMEEITSGMTDFPAVLSLEDQGRFMLGYYHQTNALYKSGKTADDTSN